MTKLMEADHPTIGKLGLKEVRAVLNRVLPCAPSLTGDHLDILSRAALRIPGGPQRGWEKTG